MEGIRIAEDYEPLVGFQRETVEDIDWKRIWGQLKWMNGFSKGYRGRIGVLTGIRIFFVLVGIAYALVYATSSITSPRPFRRFLPG